MTNKQKNAAKMKRMQNKIDAGILSDRFPGVSSIVIHMKYFHRGMNHAIMERTVNFFPGSYAYFHMECMSKGCVEGGFDLDWAIAQLVRNRRESGEGKLVCDGENTYSDHSKVDYKITIDYGGPAR
ncbi:MAG: hypothetical protein M1510_07550 [Nitrospirae bacterium]|nr:hypothetical protein [Nitrospirota bacterium]MCL5236956.1 hypothetical protein [Nitrospirota bacterium]